MTNSKETHTKEGSATKTSDLESLASDKLFKKAPKAAKEQSEPKANDDNKEIDALKAEIEQLKAQHKEAIQQQKIQHHADIDNMRKIHKREEEKARNFGIQNLAKDLLNIADALHQGISSCPEEHKQGLEMILQIFEKTLQQHDILTIAPKRGDAYNHHVHEAMVTQPSNEVADNHILQIVQNGYQIKERILRPARVVVAKNTEK